MPITLTMKGMPEPDADVTFVAEEAPWCSLELSWGAWESLDKPQTVTVDAPRRQLAE